MSTKDKLDEIIDKYSKPEKGPVVCPPGCAGCTCHVMRMPPCHHCENHAEVTYLYETNDGYEVID